MSWKTLSAFFLFTVAGCLGPAADIQTPKYFNIEFPHEAVSCPGEFRQPLQIWPLTSTAPYDRSEMVIQGPDQEVKFSSLYQWISPPGRLISDVLIQDLTRAELFSLIVTSADSLRPSLQLGGTVFKFAWQEENNSARAILDVIISIWRKDDQSDTLFREHYRFHSPLHPRNQPESFAQSMSRLIGELSLTLRQDLCALIAADDNW